MPKHTKHVRPRVGLYTFYEAPPPPPPRGPARHPYNHDNDGDDNNDDDDDYHRDHNHDDVLIHSEQFRIIDQVRYPGWVKVTEDEYQNDFALLKLSGPSSKPWIRINRKDYLPANGQEVIAMGVGNTHADYESKAHTLRQVSLNAMENIECGQVFDLERNDSYVGRIQPSHLCTTGGPHNERDSWYVVG